MSEDLIELDVDVDLDAVLSPKPDEEKHHEFYMEEADLRLIARALRGEDPKDDAEREARRIILNGIVYQLTGDQEHPV